jgi:hypothetical protein
VSFIPVHDTIFILWLRGRTFKYGIFMSEKPLGYPVILYNMNMIDDNANNDVCSLCSMDIGVEEYVKIHSRCVARLTPVPENSVPKFNLENIMEEFKVGDVVKTIEDDGSKDWASGARTHVKWGIEGEIIRSCRGHGLCYEVEHENEDYKMVKAFYNHGELSMMREYMFVFDVPIEHSYDIHEVGHYSTDLDPESPEFLSWVAETAYGMGGDWMENYEVNEEEDVRSLEVYAAPVALPIKHDDYAKAYLKFQNSEEEEWKDIQEEQKEKSERFLYEKLKEKFEDE